MLNQDFYTGYSKIHTRSITSKLRDLYKKAYLRVPNDQRLKNFCVHHERINYLQSILSSKVY